MVRCSSLQVEPTELANELFERRERAVNWFQRKLGFLNGVMEFLPITVKKPMKEQVWRRQSEGRLGELILDVLC